MKTICVDDEPLAVEYTLRQCTRLPEIEEAKGFTDSLLALDYLRAHPVDLAILDINMPQIDGISEIMEMEKGVLRVKTDTFVCDAYLFYSGDSDTINAYRGEYMSSYSWASMTEAILSWRTTNR